MSRTGRSSRPKSDQQLNAETAPSCCGVNDGDVVRYWPLARWTHNPGAWSRDRARSVGLACRAGGPQPTGWGSRTSGVHRRLGGSLRRRRL